MDKEKKAGDQPSMAGKQAQLKEELRQMQALQEEMQAQLRRQQAAQHVPPRPPMMGAGGMNLSGFGQQMNPMAFPMGLQPPGPPGGGFPRMMGGPGLNFLNQQGQGMMGNEAGMPGNAAHILLQQQRQLADLLFRQRQGSQQQHMPYGGNPTFSGANDAERRGSSASSAGSQQLFGLAQVPQSPMPISGGILDSAFAFDSPGEAMRRDSLGSFGSGAPGMSPLKADFGPLQSNISGVGQPEQTDMRQRADLPPPPPLTAGGGVHQEDDIDVRVMKGSPTQAGQEQSPLPSQAFLSLSDQTGMSKQSVPSDQIESIESMNVQYSDQSGSAMASNCPPRRSSFLEGTFEGGWQSNEDLPDRRTVIYHIISVIEQMKPDARKMSDRLPLMAKRLEEHLYRSARTKQEYLDQSTLKSRLQMIAEGLEAHRPAPHQRPAMPVPADVSMDCLFSVENDVSQPPAEKAAEMPSSVGYGIERASGPAVTFAPSTAGGILKMATAKYHDPFAVAKKNMVVRYQQQRLLLLRHASKCKVGPTCTTKHCQQMVLLWRHMKKCRDKDCQTAHCLSSRMVLNHYRKCKSERTTASCEVCGPVIRQVRVMKMHEAAHQEEDSPTEIDEPYDVSTTETPLPLPSPLESADSSCIGPQQSDPKAKQLEELRIAREKISQQQQLLKQLQEQQSKVMMQQQMLRDHRQPIVQHQGQGVGELQQQQDLLERLQKQVLEQEHRLQESHLPFSDNVDGESHSTDAIRVNDVGPALLPAKGAADNRHGIISSKHPRKSQTHLEKSDSAQETSGAHPPTSIIQKMTVDSVERHIRSLQCGRHLSSRAISQKCLPLLRLLLHDPFGWVFRDPVDPVAMGLPDYHYIVKKPMHLNLILKRLEDSFYQDMESFERDTRLVFDNAILYNGEDSEVGGMAKSMLLRFTKEYNQALTAHEVDEDSMELSGDICALCGDRRKLFQPTVLYCSGSCGQQKIRRNAKYYSDHSKTNHWCGSCYSAMSESELIVLDDGSEIRKKDLQQFKNDALPEEGWVQCDYCDSWVHQICALFNGRKNKSSSSYMCPKCDIAKRTSGELLVSGDSEQLKLAKDLPHCKMSENIEGGVRATLEKAYATRAQELGVDVSEVEKAEPLYIRVVSNMEKTHVVRDEMYQRYSEDGCASEFPVRSKCIALFQSIHGVDVLLFAMYVYEYDHSCPAPNRRRVYISYVDSVQYFEPNWCRTTAYHSVMIEYLRYVKERGFRTAHIWSCPPSPEDDYILYCHPKHQLIPSDERLCQWYVDMLGKAKAEGIVLQTKTLYDEYFRNGGADAPAGPALTPMSLPYFEGDYIPGEIENIIKELEGEDGEKSPKREENAKPGAGHKPGTRSNPGTLVNLTQDKVMLRLAFAISNMKENFMVVHLRSREFAAAVERGDDISCWDEEGDCASPNKKQRTEEATKAEPKRTDKAADECQQDEPVRVVDTAENGDDSQESEMMDNVLSGTETDKVGTESIEGEKSAMTEKPSTDEPSTSENDKPGSEPSDDNPKEQNDGAEGHVGNQGKEEAATSATAIPTGMIPSEVLSDRSTPEISNRTAKRDLDTSTTAVPSTYDPDEPQEHEMFESRQQFLNYCQASHFQFDELRRAKHSTMMVLFHLHNPSAPMFLQQCGACYREITHGIRYHCNDCSNFDLCEDCYEPVVTGLWAKDSRFTHDKNHTFIPINTEAPPDTQKSREERSRKIKLHLDLLMHAATCTGCSLHNCQRMKKLFEHVKTCEVTYKNGCKICTRLLALLSMHARLCTTRGSCRLPFCDRIRERQRRLKQQQQHMDDRRRHAQNSHYRGASREPGET